MKQLAKFDVNEKRFTVSVPFEHDESLSIKSWGKDDKVAMIGDIKIAEPVFKSLDHPKWYDICHYDGMTDTHKVLCRIQVDYISDAVKPIQNLPDVTGVTCDTCKIKLADIHDDISKMTQHVKDCGGKFTKEADGQ